VLGWSGSGSWRCRSPARSGITSRSSPRRWRHEEFAASTTLTSSRDADEQVDLWGKYLAEELSAIYREQSAVVASAVPPT